MRPVSRSSYAHRLHRSLHGGKLPPFQLRVHALLTQHSNFRTCASGNYGAATSSLISNDSFTFRPGSRRLISPGAPGQHTPGCHAGVHLPGSFCPPDTQRGAAFAETVCPLAVITKRSPETACPTYGHNQQAHAVPVRTRPLHGQRTNLNHRTQFFVKQRRQAIVPREAISALMPQ